MRNILNQMAHIEKVAAILVLNKAVDFKIVVQVKMAEQNRIVNTRLQRQSAKKQFYLAEGATSLEPGSEVTIKIIVENKLFFLKSVLKQGEENLYFDNLDHLYELVRRKKPRFGIPAHWSQTAVFQSMDSDLKSTAQILELSASGMKVKMKAELPQFMKNQDLRLNFKVFRRAEVSVKARVIHTTKNKSGGPTMGLEFSETSQLIQNKIQNICDDLAFFYASEAATA